MWRTSSAQWDRSTFLDVGIGGPIAVGDGGHGERRNPRLIDTLQKPASEKDVTVHHATDADS
jgi:hypothetical protein